MTGRTSPAHGRPLTNACASPGRHAHLSLRHADRRPERLFWNVRPSRDLTESILAQLDAIGDGVVLIADERLCQIAASIAVIEREIDRLRREACAAHRAIDLALLATGGRPPA